MQAIYRQMERNGGHFVYSKLIVKRYDNGWSPLTLEWLEGSYCYSGVISSAMNKGSKEHLKPIDSLL